MPGKDIPRSEIETGPHGLYVRLTLWENGRYGTVSSRYPPTGSYLGSLENGISKRAYRTSVSLKKRLAVSGRGGRRNAK